jgi:hypothetical protein
MRNGGGGPERRPEGGIGKGRGGGVLKQSSRGGQSLTTFAASSTRMCVLEKAAANE